MPSSSRKRNKGKDRKAKQQAEKKDRAMNVMYNMWSGMLFMSGCDHGCAMIVPDKDHPVAAFMNNYFLQFTATEEGILLLKSAVETYPQVFHNEIYRKMVLDILIRNGTNILITEGINDHLETANSLAAIILVLEEYDKTNDFDSAIAGRAISLKRRHLTAGISSNERDLLKFYRKRVTCKCLKRMHLESRKSTPKMARCFNCNVEKERASLSVCSRCMIAEYCSRECHVANWDQHRRDCEECGHANILKQVTPVSEEDLVAITTKRLGL